MKKKLFASLISVLLLLTACSGDGIGTGSSVGDSYTSSGTIGSIGDFTETGDAVANVGTIKTEIGKTSVNFKNDNIAFELLFANALGFRNAKNANILSKSGKTSILSQSSDKLNLQTKWSNNDVDLKTDLSITDSEITLGQSVNVSAGGISGTSFTLKLDDSYNVIVPTSNGVRLTKSNPTAYGTKWEYQYGLQMQMIILEGKNGGVVIYADDDFTQYKNIEVKLSTGYFMITIETVPQAPFTNYKEFETVNWKIIPYEGNWASGSAIYRDFAYEKFCGEEAATLRPDWVDDIQFCVLTDMVNKNELDALAQKVDPSKTLLQVPSWRKERYDVNWPDYTPLPELKEMIEYAHSLGFKVQLHCNMHGCQMELPEYQKVKQYHMIHCYSGQKMGEDFVDKNGNSYRFAHINPASSEWRKIVITAIADAVKEVGADAVHLDQSLICYNDANGYVDGLTSLQGNVLFHKELLEALPDGVALGGEGTTDFNAIYSNFLQSHVYGIDSNLETWNFEQAEQIVPLVTSVYTHLKNYQWPGLPTVANEEYYLAWYLRGKAIGHLPTIMRESPQSISGNSPLMKAMLKETNWYMENDPVRVFGGWDDNTIMRWRLKDGTFAQARRDKYGYVLLANENDPSSVITRIVYGTNTAKIDGTIEGWAIYDEDAIYGLDPEHYYLVSDEQRNTDTTHITSLTDKVSLVSLEDQSAYMKLSFSSSSSKVDTVSFEIVSQKALSGVLVKSGSATFEKLENGKWRITAPISESIYLLYENVTASKYPLSLYSESFTTYLTKIGGTSSFTDTTVTGTGTFGGKLRKKITVSVPGVTMNSLEYVVALPNSESLSLDFLVGTQDKLYVPLPVSVEINGKTIWSGSVFQKDEVTEMSLDISEFKGQTVFVTFNVDGRLLPGATHKVIWANPTISK